MARGCLTRPLDWCGTLGYETAAEGLSAQPLRMTAPVWSKNSCGLSLVVFEQATKPFTILNQAVIPALWPGLWQEQHIALALMIALLVVMVHILVEHVPQGVFAEQHHP